MKILQLFKKHSKAIYLKVIVLSALNSLSYGGLLVLINRSVSQIPLPYFPEYDWLLFIVLVISAIIVGKVFQTMMIKLTHNTLYNFELSLLSKVRHAFYENFEKIGDERVYTAIGDTRVLAQAPEVLLGVFNALVITTCGIGYMIWMSPVGGITIILVMTSLLLFYLYRNRKVEQMLNKVRDLENNYFRYLKDFLFGFKEIKMSAKRNTTIYQDYLKKNRTDGKTLGIDTDIRYMNNEITGNAGWYVIIGIMLFVLPVVLKTGNEVTTSFLVTALYLMGPISTLIVFIPFMTRSKIALERMEQLENEIDTHIRDQEIKGSVDASVVKFEQLKFKDIVYQYQKNTGDNGFKLGPIDLTINRGEIIFIVGGNGSGKSSFFNILTGLYKPTSGDIFFNQQKITHENYNTYSNRLSAIFTNNYVFDENYNGFNISKNNPQLMKYLDLMELSKVITMDENNHTISTNLSKGQQKRLAMVYALLEDRQILVLDEWAAEQDPYFRAYFYKELLPYLKSQGKTIVAITHDDAYYHMADRIIRFEYGKIDHKKQTSDIGTPV